MTLESAGEHAHKCAMTHYDCITARRYILSHPVNGFSYDVMAPHSRRVDTARILPFLRFHMVIIHLGKRGQRFAIICFVCVITGAYVVIRTVVHVV